MRTLILNSTIRKNKKQVAMNEDNLGNKANISNSHGSNLELKTANAPVSGQDRSLDSLTVISANGFEIVDKLKDNHSNHLVSADKLTVIENGLSGGYKTSINKTRNIDNSHSSSGHPISSAKKFVAGQKISVDNLIISADSFKGINKVEYHEKKGFEWIILKNIKKTSTLNDVIIYGSKGNFYLRVGSFMIPNNAANLREKLLKLRLQYEVIQFEESKVLKTINHSKQN